MVFLAALLLSGSSLTGCVQTDALDLTFACCGSNPGRGCCPADWDPRMGPCVNTNTGPVTNPTTNQTIVVDSYRIVVVRPASPSPGGIGGVCNCMPGEPCDVEVVADTCWCTERHEVGQDATRAALQGLSVGGLDASTVCVFVMAGQRPEAGQGLAPGECACADAGLGLMDGTLSACIRSGPFTPTGSDIDFWNPLSCGATQVQESCGQFLGSIGVP